MWPTSTFIAFKDGVQQETVNESMSWVKCQGGNKCSFVPKAVDLTSVWTSELLPLSDFGFYLIFYYSPLDYIKICICI